MTVTELEPLDIVSGASISGVAFDVPVERARLERHLRELGPLCIAGPDARERHVLTYELWTVTDGRSMLGGVDQHEAAALFAGTLGGFAFALWGAAFRRRASAVAARYGRELSRKVALGPYHELLIGVPDVCFDGGEARHVAVLEMVTDDAFAASVDRIFGYGYGKVRGHFSLPEPGSFEVRASDAPLVSGRFVRDGAPDGAMTERVNARWAQPFLGRLSDGSLRASRLERRLDAPGAISAPVRGDVRVSTSRMAGAPDGRFAVGGGGAFAFGFAGVPARITRPMPMNF